MELLSVQDLTFSYPGQTVPALERLSFDISAGEFLVIAGPSGCGKSTLLRQFKTALTPHGSIQGQLLFLSSVDATKDISIYINSPGGGVYAGLGIYDTMQFVGPDVATICTGMAASMAAVLLCAGAKGKRAALRHSRTMIHQPMGGAQGQVSDIEITAREIKKLRDELYTIMAEHSGQPFEKIEKDSDRDYWMTSPEALEYGMIDEILGKKKKHTPSTK